MNAMHPERVEIPRISASIQEEAFGANQLHVQKITSMILTTESKYE